MASSTLFPKGTLGRYVQMYSGSFEGNILGEYYQHYSGKHLIEAERLRELFQQWSCRELENMFWYKYENDLFQEYLALWDTPGHPHQQSDNEEGEIFHESAANHSAASNNTTAEGGQHVDDDLNANIEDVEMLDSASDSDSSIYSSHPLGSLFTVPPAMPAQKSSVSQAKQDEIANKLLYDITATAPSRPPYALHEWEEPSDWMSIVHGKMNDIIKHDLHVCDFSEAQLIKDRNSPVSNLAAIDYYAKNWPVHTKSHLQVDCDGKRILMKMKGGLMWAWSKEQAAKLSKIPLEATLTLTETYAPPMIKKNNKRHPNAVAERKESADPHQ
ncbi:hypothetical protein P7C71_g2407, partial [Lecanoromycetidae sp. Uapishka_2]